MKRFWKVLAAAAVLLILIYRLGTLNFYLGSNSAFFSSAFDDENSSWYCKDLGLTATVVHDSGEGKYMIVSETENNPKCILYPHGDKTVEVLKYSADTIAEEEKHILFADVRYKKHFGRVYAFEIAGVSSTSLFKEGEEKITFRLVKED